MGAEATLYLTARGVQVVGTDAWSWDAPFSHTARRWAETRDPSIIWEGHKAGRIRPYYQIEKLTNLAAIPATGFTFSCFRSEEHTSELQSLMRISYAVFCLKKKNKLLKASIHHSISSLCYPHYFLSHYID